MVDLAVLSKKGDISHAGFDAQDEVELVVHFDRYRSPLVLNPPA
jgi:hypothetical protein